MPEEIAWYHLAICRGMETRWFYDDYEADPVFAGVIDDICESCPVRKACLRDGIENSEYGVWGGVYLNNGNVDENKNAHKTEEDWESVKDAIIDG